VLPTRGDCNYTTNQRPARQHATPCSRVALLWQQPPLTSDGASVIKQNKTRGNQNQNQRPEFDMPLPVGRTTRGETRRATCPPTQCAPIRLASRSGLRELLCAWSQALVACCCTRCCKFSCQAPIHRRVWHPLVSGASGALSLASTARLPWYALVRHTDLRVRHKSAAVDRQPILLAKKPAWL
jgi:hypothetical protein